MFFSQPFKHELTKPQPTKIHVIRIQQRHEKFS